MGMSEELPETLEGFDIQDGLRRVAGNRKLLRKLFGKFKAGNVLLKPAYPGTGVIAGTTVGAICRLAGLKDVLTKSIGTTNPLTLSRAALNGLDSLRSRKEVDQIRGKNEPEAQPEAQEVENAA